MGKSSGSAPQPPDPAATAQAQAAANKDAAIATGQLNMVNQVTPYGSLEYTQRGTSPQGTPQYTATQTLSPEQQQLYNLTSQAGIKYGQTANDQLNAVSSKLAQPVDFSTLGPAPTIDQNSWQRAFDSIIQRNQPNQQADLAALQTRLANSGIQQGSDAYTAAMRDYQQGVNDFRLGAQQQAQGQETQDYGLQQSARNQAINELTQQRSIPLNELAAMLTGSQVQNPSFVNTPTSNVNPADIMGATYGSYNGQLQAYQSDQARQAANMQALAGILGGAATGAAYKWSDRRLKRDITLIGRLRNGLKLYRYRYLWAQDWQIGLMAQEVARIIPGAVRLAQGHLQVNYAEAALWR